MKPCAKHRETLLLDVYGELAPEIRSAWEVHLKACEACRQEKQRVQRLVGEAQRIMGPPRLSESQVDEAVYHVRKRIAGTRDDKGRHRHFGFRPLRFVAAASALCVMILVWATLDIRGPNLPFKILTTFRNDAQEHALVEELEIIQHLDMLREMDAIRKLVQIVDDVDRKVPDTETHSDIREKNRHGKRKVLA